MPAPSALTDRVTTPSPARVPRYGLERGRRPPHGPQSPDEAIVGIALTVRWMLITGRRLDQRPELHELSCDQLIDFWADDYPGGSITSSREAGST
jgi:hypothetical protein